MNSDLQGLSIQLELPDLWQQEAVRDLKSGLDLVIDAPTGAGKTYIFELLVKSGALKGQAVYTVPTRALANDKWREWKTAGWNVGIATGDLAVNVDAPVLVATLETQRERLLRGDGPTMLVIDEYQMIADPQRGLNYELAVVLSPLTTQLLLLSGSVANPQDIVAWMERLGRHARLIQTRERPVPLEDIPIPLIPGRVPQNMKGFWPRLAILALTADFAPLLIFAPQRRAAEKIAARINEALPQGEPLPLSQNHVHVLGRKLAKMVQNRVAYHHSGLSYAQRAGIIEPLAKAGQLRVVVATTGLAAGINFSVRSVCVPETRYSLGPFQREIEPDELLQMFGRAGRRGLDDIGYILSTDGGPRLNDGQPRQLRRTNQIDWPTLLRVMKEAADRGESPFQAAVSLKGHLFSTQKIPLGFEKEVEKEEPVAESSDGLFGLKPQRREVLNSESEWEKERPDCRIETTLEKALVFDRKRGWRPALRTGWFMRDQITNLGRLCKLSLDPPVYGAEIAVGQILEDGQVQLTKRWRSLTRTPKNKAILSREEAEKRVLPILSRRAPETRLDRFEERQGLLLALLDYSDVPIDAYRDSHGAHLVDPERRTLTLEYDTSYFDEATGDSLQPSANSAAHAWRKLGLIESDGTPTLRGQIFSFFQKGEGLAVAAALEEESYPVEDIALHIANLRAGHRFEDRGEGGEGSQRLASVCRQTYGPVDYDIYLRLGLPPTYGDSAAETIQAYLEGQHLSRRDPDSDLGRGDVERAMLEWFSLLRHIRHAPDLDNDRWMTLKEAAIRLLKQYSRYSTTAIQDLPTIDAHILHKKVNHRVFIR